MMECDNQFSRVEGFERCDAGNGSAPLLVIIPTYNECGNVTRLLSAIASLHPRLVFDAFIVDDGSTDGTRESVRAYAKTADHGVYLMSRKGKFGLGNAYLDAYRWMFERLPPYQTIVHMDADFSHDPNMIPLLVSQSSAYGVAIGSRYVVGGCTPDWNWRRVLISFSGNTYMRCVLKIFFPSYPVKDNTSGFIAWKRQVLSDVLQYDIPGDGYSFLTAEKLIAFRIGFPAIEVPIVFRDRRLGVSKISKSIIIEALSMPWRLAMKFRRISFSSSLLPPPEGGSSMPSSDGDMQDEVSGRIDSGIASRTDILAKVENFFAKNLFWFLVPVIFSALICFAFILPGFMGGFYPWWRIPVIAPVVPDMYLYQSWLGAVAQGLPQGQFFYWYIPIFRTLWLWTSGSLFLPEFLGLTFVLSAIGSILIFPWTVKQWVPESTIPQRRMLTVAFLSVWTLVLGFRPGYYSWYAPAIFFGFGALAAFRTSLIRRRWKMSILWMVGSLTAFFIYPWCFLFGVVYIAASVIMACVESMKRIRFVSAWIFLCMTALALAGAALMTPIMAHPLFAPIIDLYHRTGVTPSRMPFIANALLVIVCWIGVFYLRGGKNDSEISHVLAWLCLLLLWLDYPFTGFFIFNEHFMQVIAPMGVLSLGLVFADRLLDIRPTFALKFFLVISICFIALYIWKSFLPHQSVRSFIVHLVNWVPVALAGCFLFFSFKRRFVVMAGMAIMVGLGAWGLGSIIRTQAETVASVKSFEPIIAWIRQDGPAIMRYCTDTGTASVLGAHTGRAFYPNETMIYERVTNDVERARFRAIARVFDVESAGERDRWNYYSVYALRSSCDAFPLQTRFLRTIGVSDPIINRISGCNPQEIQSRVDVVTRAIRGEDPAPPLSSVCDRVIIRDELSAFWDLSAVGSLIASVGGYNIYQAQ